MKDFLKEALLQRNEKSEKQFTEKCDANIVHFPDHMLYPGRHLYDSYMIATDSRNTTEAGLAEVAAMTITGPVTSLATSKVLRKLIFTPSHLFHLFRGCLVSWILNRTEMVSKLYRLLLTSISGVFYLKYVLR